MSECIKISQLLFRWPDTITDLLNIPNLSIKQGERVFIHGASGSGKSTLLNLLAGTLSPSQGSISILGQNISASTRAKHDSFRADHFGIIFQYFNRIPYLSVIDNILLPLSFSKHRQSKLTESKSKTHDHVLELLDSLGLDAKSIANQNITKLSTGQQQRVATARALIGSPEIIIADEPTSALDASAKHDFVELLFKHANKNACTLILVSHDHSLATMFDQTYAMNTFTSSNPS